MARNNTITARDIIYKAFYMLGVTDFGEVANGEDTSNALSILNEILESWSGGGVIIPYLNQVNFMLKQGKSEYVLGKTDGADVNSLKIAQLVSINFRYDNTVYPVNILSQNVYYENLRVVNLTSLPFNAFLQNTVYDSRLIFYPIPNKDYECYVRAKFVFDDIELDDRLDEIPPHARQFFRYALARELCDFYSKPWQPKQEQIYNELKARMFSNAELDLTITTDNLSPNSYYTVKSGYGY